MNKFVELLKEINNLQQKYIFLEKNSIEVDLSMPSHYFGYLIRAALNLLYTIDVELVYLYRISEGGLERLVLKENSNEVISALELFSFELSKVDKDNVVRYVRYLNMFIENLKNVNPILNFHGFLKTIHDVNCE